MASSDGGRDVQEKQKGDLLVLGSDSKKRKDQSSDDEMSTKCADRNVKEKRSASCCHEQLEKTEDEISWHIGDPEARKVLSEYPPFPDSTSESEGSDDDDLLPEQSCDEVLGPSPSDDDPPLGDSSDCDSSDCDLSICKYWYKYTKHLHKSSGYYVDTYFYWRPLCWGSPYAFKVSELKRSDPEARSILDGLDFVIAEYNKGENPNLELVKMIYAVVFDEYEHEFKVTFLGKDVSSGETDYYQTYFLHKEKSQRGESKKSLFELVPERAYGATHYLEKKGKEVPKRTSQRVADA